MTDDLLIQIRATSSQYDAALLRATQSTLRYDAALKKTAVDLATIQKQMDAEIAARAAKQAAALEKVGRGLSVAGLALGVGLGLSAKAAVDWEAQWTKVSRVLEGSPQQLAAVEAGLRGLAKELPVTHEELAAIAADAGQLGVRTGDIVNFTKVIAMLGESSDLVGDEGATAIARLMNILHTAPSEVGNTASAVVALGNAGASTASEITNMGLRIAAAGHNVGLTEGQVLGISNELLSLGVRAEAGGTAVSQTLQLIDKSVKGNTDTLQGFADVAGVTARKFAQQWEKDPVVALSLFFDGLERVKESGGDLYGTLNALGISGARQIATITALAGSGDDLARSIRIGNDAFRDGSALQEQFAKTNDTAAAKVQRAQNAVHDLAIDLGETLLPIIGDAAEKTSALFNSIGDLPGPVKDVITIFGAATAATLLFGGAAIYATGKYNKFLTTLSDLEAAGSNINKKMVAMRVGAGALAAGLFALNSAVGDSNDEFSQMLTVAGSAAAGFAVTGGPWGAAIGAAIGILTAFTQANQEAKQRVSELADTLDEQTGALTENSREWAANQVIKAGLADDANRLGIGARDLTRALLDQGSAASDLSDHLRAVIAAHQEYHVAGRGTAAVDDEQARAARALLELIGDTSGVVDDARAEWQFSRDAKEKDKDATVDQARAVDDLAPKLRAVTGATKGHAGSARDDADALGEEEKATRKALRAHNALADALLESVDSGIAFRAAIRDARAALDDYNGSALDGTKAGDAQLETLIGIANAFNELPPKVRNSQKAYDSTRATFLDIAEKMNIPTARAEQMADNWLKSAQTIENRKVTPEVDDRKARDQISGFKDHVNRELAGIHDEPVKVTLTAQAQSILTALSSGPGRHMGEALIGHAAGDAVRGGVPGRDSVPALLMPDEHIATTAEVRAAGRGSLTQGHQVWRAIRRMALRGELPRYGDLQPFADGGPVLSASESGTSASLRAVDRYLAAVAHRAEERLSANVSRALTHLPSAGQLGPGGRLTPAQMYRGQGFAKSQVGKPYIWGGVGPGGYDCSGFQSAILNSAMGMYPYSRRGSTSTMPWAGSAPGTGRYTIGWSTNVGGSGIGHTSGNIGGLNVESYGGHGPAVGSGARSPLDAMFHGLMHYDSGGILRPGLTLAHNGTGRPERVVTHDQDRRGQPMSFARLVEILSRPDFATTLDQVNRSLRAMRGEARDVARAERQLQAARDASKNAAASIKDSEHELEVARNREKVDKEQISRIEQRIRAQRQASRAADQDLERAEKSLERQRDDLSKATDRWRQKQQELVDQSKEWASTFTSLGAAFGGEGTSNTAQGLLAKLRAAGNAGEKFTSRLQRLRRLGLNQGILEQLRDEGPTEQGLALASSLAQHPGLIDSINKQQKRLGRVAAAGGAAMNGRIVQVNLNGPIHTHDIHAAARAIHRREKQALAIAGQG